MKFFYYFLVALGLFSWSECVPAPAYEHVSAPSFQVDMTMDNGSDKQDLLAEVLAVVDFSAYSYFLEKASGNDDEATKNIKFYYAHVFDMMNKMYQSINAKKYRYRIRMTDIVILKTAEESPFTEIASGSILVNKGTVTEPKYVKKIDSDIALTDFRNFMRGNKNYDYDAALAFTKYETVDRTSGKGYRESACSKYSYGIVKQGFLALTAHVAAHEMSHILGAEHDYESDNPCFKNTYYSMIPSLGSNGNDLNTSSPCTNDLFAEYISSLKRNCLAIDDVAVPNPIDVTKELSIPYGSIHGAQQQCMEAGGSNSVFCPDARNVSTLCHTMMCFNEAEADWCRNIPGSRALDGTSCGDKQWCMSGQCIKSDEAPELKDECWYGDFPEMVYGMYYCSDFKNKPELCKIEPLRRKCCKTCQQIISSGH